MRLAAFLPVALVVPLLATGAGAEEVALQPRQAPGDAYLLSLNVTTDTQALSRGSQGRAAGETVRLDYQAYVVVLEVDERGRARRERHDGVRLSFERPDASGSLFEPDTSFEVRRSANHSVRIYIGGRRADRDVEEIVAEVLRSQLEHSLEAQLLDPGRPVARSSELVQRMQGVTTPTPGVAGSVAWRLHSSTRSDQRVMEVQAAAARQHLTVAAEGATP